MFISVSKNVIFQFFLVVFSLIVFLSFRHGGKGLLSARREQDTSARREKAASWVVVKKEGRKTRRGERKISGVLFFTVAISKNLGFSYLYCYFLLFHFLFFGNFGGLFGNVANFFIYLYIYLFIYLSIFLGIGCQSCHTFFAVSEKFIVKLK